MRTTNKLVFSPDKMSARILFKNGERSPVYKTKAIAILAFYSFYAKGNISREEYLRFAAEILENRIMDLVEKFPKNTPEVTEMITKMLGSIVQEIKDSLGKEIKRTQRKARLEMSRCGYIGYIWTRFGISYYPLTSKEEGEEILISLFASGLIDEIEMRKIRSQIRRSLLPVVWVNPELN